jgi:hypothetical protein
MAIGHFESVYLGNYVRRRRISGKWKILRRAPKVKAGVFPVVGVELI